MKIHSFTVACLILNRTIGSGIFVTPSRILFAEQRQDITALLGCWGLPLVVCPPSMAGVWAFNPTAKGGRRKYAMFTKKRGRKELR